VKAMLVLRRKVTCPIMEAVAVVITKLGTNTITMLAGEVEGTERLEATVSSILERLPAPRLMTLAKGAMSMELRT